MKGLPLSTDVMASSLLSTASSAEITSGRFVNAKSTKSASWHPESFTRSPGMKDAGVDANLVDLLDYYINYSTGGSNEDWSDYDDDWSDYDDDDWSDYDDDDWSDYDDEDWSNYDDEDEEFLGEWDY